MSLTDQQTAIVSLASTGAKSFVAISGPGTGKTFTSVKTMYAAPPGYKLALAFNRSIANELASKAPPSIQVKTSHSAGLALLRKRFRPRINTQGPYAKTSKARRHVMRTFPTKYADVYGEIAKALVQGRGQGLGSEPTSPTDWIPFLLDTGLDADIAADVASRLPSASDSMNEDTGEVDFADMLLLPIVHNLRPSFTYTYIWGDEIQDWSSVQIRAAKLFAGEHSRFFGFGDPFQSIYAFRGADVHAVDNVVSAFSAQRMPLSVSFRCPTSVILLARQRNPSLTPAPGAVEGHIEGLSSVGMRALAARFGPVAWMMGFIFYCSHQPGDELPLPGFFLADKLAHTMVYAALGAAWLHALDRRWRRRHPALAAWSAVAFGLFYGLSDEYHQSFVPGRFPSVADLVADGVGGLASGALFWWRRRGKGA